LGEEKTAATQYICTIGLQHQTQELWHTSKPKTPMKKLYTLLFACLFTNSWAQWTPITGVSGVIYDLSVAGTQLLATNGSIFASSDGQTFSASNTGITGGSCRTLAQFDGHAWAGSSGSDIFKSTDNGTNWTRVGGRSGLASVRTTSIFVDGNNILYGTDGNGGSHYSTNSGSSFSGSEYPFGANKTVAKDIVKLGNDLFCSSLQNVFKSTDGGVNWTEITTLPTISGNARSLCAIDGGLLLSSYGGGVYRSVDAGASWTKVLGGSAGSSSNNITRVQYINGIAFAGGALGQLHFSNDNGVSWTKFTDAGIGMAEVVQAVAVFNGHLYVGTNLGFYRKPFSATGITTLNRPTIQVYPVPSVDYIQFEGLEAGSEIRITDLSGKTVLQTVLSDDKRISLAPLHVGTYIVLSSGRVAKIIKQ
jgi:photosystem II stability/assembly factor-like uncharacterized protein